MTPWSRRVHPDERMSRGSGWIGVRGGPRDCPAMFTACSLQPSRSACNGWKRRNAIFNYGPDKVELGLRPFVPAADPDRVIEFSGHGRAEVRHERPCEPADVDHRLFARPLDPSAHRLGP